MENKMFIYLQKICYHVVQRVVLVAMVDHLIKYEIRTLFN